MHIAGADQMFMSLKDQVQALENINVSQNMSHDLFIARVKKYLSSENYAIDFADLVDGERKNI